MTRPVHIQADRVAPTVDELGWCCSCEEPYSGYAGDYCPYCDEPVEDDEDEDAQDLFGNDLNSIEARRASVVFDERNYP